MAQEKAKYKKKTLYFNQENLDVYEYLSTRKDFSDYICNLIKEDLGMSKEGEPSLDLSKVLSELEVIKKKIDKIKVAPFVIPVDKENDFIVTKKEIELEHQEQDKTKAKRRKPRSNPADIL